MFRLKCIGKIAISTSLKCISRSFVASSPNGGKTIFIRSIPLIPRQSFILQNVRQMSAITIPLESLGDSITTAVVVTWSKQKGDTVKEDDVIAVVETDKVTMDIRAKTTGTFVDRLVEAGSEISVGAPLYTLDSGVTKEAATPSAQVAASKPESTPAQSPIPTSAQLVNVPVMGESITQGMLARWSVKPGDEVQADAVVASIETDKVTVEVHSPNHGFVGELFAKEGGEVNVGQPLFSLLSAPTKAGPAATPAATKETSVKAAAPAANTVSAPAPSKAAAPPASAPASAKAASAPAKSAAPSAPVFPTAPRSETRVKMSRMRQRIAQRLKEAQNTAAMLTTFQECDMSNLMALRARYKDDFEKTHGVKLGFMGAFVKASTAALVEVPAVNALIDDSTQELVYRSYVDVSVAVASPNGLVVPVLRDTQNMSIADVERSIVFYGKKAKEGALALEDMLGGTFTISNGGVFGSLYGTPIINPPQSAILGMHATKMRAVVVDGKVEARPMMYLALTYDHRIIDGREAVTFLKSVANKIEDPARLLLGL